MNKFYITTSIPYVNANPHIGFALEIIQADVLARYYRLSKRDVFFLTGTDEHGQKIEKTAKEKGETPEEFVEKISSKYKELKAALNLSNDFFIRTTDKEKHWPSVFKVWEKLKEKGDIYKKKYQGLYCFGCETFLLEKDLENGKCPVHKREPEIVAEENYFFKLSKYSSVVYDAIEKGEIKIFPEKRKNEVLSFIRQGIEDVSFSRSKEKLKWGIPVPGDESQVLYVWLDALTNYISALGYEKQSAEFKKYWPADVHCIGKDIFRFHCLIWPAILISLSLKLPKAIMIHGFITVNGQKMSKSLGNVIDPFKLVEKYKTDAVRYYLLREIPSMEDGDFTFEKFEDRYNHDLAFGIGNLLSRVRTMAQKNGFDVASPLNIVKEKKELYRKAIEDFRFDIALKEVWEIVRFSDKYIEEKRPWENKEGSKNVLGELLSTLDEISLMLSPFLPETSERIKNQIERKETFANESNLPLFPRIES
ncbi:MAG: methionine--tRNA ligase [Candidatus Pacebacteria bacterium]|nr:methionine--tRNA ligase [Candidatus Paceibacterota bacterium]MDD4466879.1 methionine--tRNA ligase [Candidatus Paceibacterota bacterium]